MEMQIRLSVIKTGGWSRLEPEAGRKPASNRIGTLTDAINEAWNYSSGKKGGWKMQVDGERQKLHATICAKFLGKDRQCSSITVDDIERLVSYFQDRNIGSDTIRNRVGSFYRALWHAQRKGWILARPVWDRPSPGQPRDFIFTPEREERIIAYFMECRDFVFADLITLAIETGCRSKELRVMSSEYYDLDAGVLRVPGKIDEIGFRTKTQRSRTVTLTPKAIETAKRVFAGKGEHERPFNFLSDTTISRRMKRAKLAMGYEGRSDFVFHSFRHTRATRLAQLTRDPFAVMSQLGHEEISTSMRYIKMASLDLSVYDSRVAQPVTQTVTLGLSR